MNTEKITVTIDSDLEDLIPGFLENRAKDTATLKNAAAASDFEILRSIGHNLKGVGGGYGFAGISELGAAIETAAKAGDLDTINLQIARLDDYLQNVEIRYQ